jgi:glutamine amidotransferase-like uncharacterized protein
MNRQNIRATAAVLLAACLAFAFTSCDSGGGSSANSGTTPGTGSLPGAPTAPVTRTFSTDVLIFTGSGTWSAEITDAEALLTSHGATYQEATSAELQAMTAAEMASFGTIFIPGGEGSTEAGSVSAATHANLREAVQQLGLSYVGFCAGAFVAVAPTPAAGQDVSYGFGVVNGQVQNEFLPTDNPNAAYEQQLLSFADGTTQDILWYGGPITPNQGVVAKYPTGDPAISEMWSGNGFVVIAGVHPDLSQGTLDSLAVTPDTTAQTTAWSIFNAALTQTPLPTY